MSNTANVALLNLDVKFMTISRLGLHLPLPQRFDGLLLAALVILFLCRKFDVDNQ
jgi:hypothetical protein